jgi:hypothetical protein
MNFFLYSGSVGEDESKTLTVLAAENPTSISKLTEGELLLLGQDCVLVLVSSVQSIRSVGIVKHSVTSRVVSSPYMKVNVYATGLHVKFLSVHMLVLMP